MVGDGGGGITSQQKGNTTARNSEQAKEKKYNLHSDVLRRLVCGLLFCSLPL